jgi:hypothetical protein
MGRPRTDLHEFIFGGSHRQDILSNNLPEIWGNALDQGGDVEPAEFEYEEDELDN